MILTFFQHSCCNEAALFVSHAQAAVLSLAAENPPHVPDTCNVLRCAGMLLSQVSVGSDGTGSDAVKSSVYGECCNSCYALAHRVALKGVCRSLADHQLAGHQLAARQLAGNQLAGHQLAKHQLAAQQLAGHQLAGHQLARHQLQDTSSWIMHCTGVPGLWAARADLLSQ